MEELSFTEWQQRLPAGTLAGLPLGYACEQATRARRAPQFWPTIE